MGHQPSQYGNLLYAAMITCTPLKTRQIFMSNALTNPQKRYLKGLAHDLRPTIMVGAKGITPSLLAELDAVLEQHELIKVKVSAEDRETRDAWIDSMVETSQASLVTRIGNIVVMFRRSKSKPFVILPKA
jgi:RNA-binding protein